MGLTQIRKIASGIFLGAVFSSANAQPFVDVINTSYQTLSTTYKDSSHFPNRSDQNFLNITLPIKLDSQNMIIARVYSERLYTAYTAYDQAYLSGPTKYSGNYSLYSVLVPIGLQHETSNKKWKLLGLAMPKLSSDFRDQISSYDFQMGGYGMATYAYSDKLKIKFGLFYNREAFGDFWVPLGAIDWKPCSWFQCYGILPNNYRFEFAAWPKHIYAGLGFKSYTRSYRLSSLYGHDYVRNNEVQAKLFVDVYLAKKFVVFAEFGRTIGYSPLVYLYGTKDRSTSAPQYFPINDAFMINVGLAYRIRFDF